MWCPELAKVPKQYIFEPWRMPKEVQKEAGCVIGVDYPNGVVEIKALLGREGGGQKQKGGGKGQQQKKKKEKYKGGAYRVIG